MDIIAATNDTLVPTGKGIFNYKDGSKYQGSLRHTQYHGAGILEYADGTYYHGEFLNGNKHGLGIMDVIDNDTLIGHFQNDKFIMGIIFREGKAYEFFYDGMYGKRINNEGVEISNIKELSIKLL